MISALGLRVLATAGRRCRRIPRGNSNVGKGPAFGGESSSEQLPVRNDLLPERMAARGPSEEIMEIADIKIDIGVAVRKVAANTLPGAARKRYEVESRFFVQGDRFARRRCVLDA